MIFRGYLVCFNTQKQNENTSFLPTDTKSSRRRNANPTRSRFERLRQLWSASAFIRATGSATCTQKWSISFCLRTTSILPDNGECCKEATTSLWTCSLPKLFLMPSLKSSVEQCLLAGVFIFGDLASYGRTGMLNFFIADVVDRGGILLARE